MNKGRSKKLDRRTCKKIAGRIVVFAVLLAFVLPLAFSFRQQDTSAHVEDLCRRMVSKHMTDIITSLETSAQVVRSSATGLEKLKKLTEEYHQVRKEYKEIEFFIEYYSPFEAKFYINGPLVPKIEMEISSEPFPPKGFQVIEENLFDPAKTDLAMLDKEYRQLLEKLNFLKEHYATIDIEPAKLQDALKLQVIRIMCLTLNGYDCTINKEALKECAYAIAGIETMIVAFGEAGLSNEQEALQAKLLGHLKKCHKKLSGHKDSDTFDRLNFMVKELDPAYSAMLAFFNSLNLKGAPLFYAVNFKASSFFSANSINKQYFSVYVADSSRLKEQAALGRFLFFDPVLSGNTQRACASCHQDTKAFADGLDKSPTFDQQAKLSRNAPTLINAAYQKLYFHDGRLFNLEEQAHAVFKNTFEMNSDAKQIVARLKQSKEYRDLFFKAFENSQDTGITPYAVLKCLSEFIKTLDSRNSRFDKYLRGNKKALTKSEVNGYNLFAGKALCGSCHFFPLFNGTVPPMYNDNEFEVIGTPEQEGGKKIDPDIGRKSVTHSFIHDHAFKTPTLRNIEYTSPYMHNGVYKNLDSVLTFYNRGGGAGSGLEVENQTLPFDSLGISKKELNDLRLFLLTLSDTTGLPHAPSRLPAFADEKLNKRKIGGEY